MNNRCRKTSLTKYLPLTLLQGFEKGYSRFACERELVTEQNWNILTSTLMAVNVVSFSFFDAQPEVLGSTLLGAGFLYCILSASSLDPNSSAWCGFPYHISSITPTICNSTGTWLLSWLCYIIIQCPHDRPLVL